MKTEELKPEKIRIEDINKEKEIFYNAINKVKKETEELIENLSGTDKDIMQAYLFILQDETLIKEIISIIENEKCNSEYRKRKAVS